MKGVQQWHALDLVDHRDEGWANEVIAAVHVMELVLDSDPVRQEGLAADFRMASGWLVAQLQAPGPAVASAVVALKKGKDAGVSGAVVIFHRIRIEA